LNAFTNPDKPGGNISLDKNVVISTKGSNQVFRQISPYLFRTPFRSRQQKLNLPTFRIPPNVHAAMASAGEISGKRLNKWVAEFLDRAIHP
jgi:hypothetical protein